MPTVRFKGEYSHITLTTPRLKIFRPKINKAYFATAKIENITTTSTTKTVQETYVVAGGDTLSKIASKKETTVDAIIKSDDKLTEANKNKLKVGQKITLPNTVVTTETNKKITFEKVNEGTLDSDLYLVVKTEDFQGYSLYFNIKQGKEKGIEEKDGLVTFKDENGNYGTKGKVKVGGLCEKHYVNVDDYAETAIYKLQIDHNDKTKKEAWQKALEGKDKKVPLYLLVEGHTVPGQEEININYQGDSEGGEIRGEVINNLWLDSDGNWFELKKTKKAPWMKFAEKEYLNYKGINENKSPLKERISDHYHKSTTLGGLHYGKKTEWTDKISWCASFVNWCFEQTQDFKKTNLSKGGSYNSLAFDWTPKNWENGEKCQPFYGAVITLKYSHTAFIVGKNTKKNKYVYLGGNQGGKNSGEQQIRYGTITIGKEKSISKPIGYKVNENEYKLKEMSVNADGSYKTTR